MTDQEISVNSAEIVEEIRAKIRQKQEIDIEEIMEGIRSEAAFGPGEPDGTESPETPGTAADVGAQLTLEADYLRKTAVIPYYWDFGGGIRGLLRRLARFACRCFALPIRDRQNDFNAHAAGGMEATAAALRDVQRRLDLLEAENRALRSEIDEMKRQNTP